MTLSQSTLTVVALAAAAIAILSVMMNLMLGRRLAAMRRDRRIRLPEARGDLDPTGTITQEVVGLSAEMASLQDAIGRAVQRVGLIRFDAFEDMGGQLSFAAALLDARGDGIVLSSINGRSETRIYAKPIEGGTSRYNLSDEEEAAIRRALGAVRR